MASDLDKPAVLTPKVQAQIIESLARGNFLRTTCTAAGTTRQTFEYWQKLCRAGAEHAQVYADFFAACDRAMAQAEENALMPIVAGAMGWQGPAWFLERRYPKRWGKKETVIHKDGDTDMSTMSDKELEAIRTAKG